MPIDALSRADAAAEVIAAATDGRPHATTALAVHGLMEAVKDPALRGRLWDFDLVVADGQPVRWAVNSLFRQGLEERVAGPDLMPAILERAQEADLGIAFYGSLESTLSLLQQNLRKRFPSLRIVAAMPSRFRPYVSEAELADDLTALKASGAAIVFVGLGCPRQEVWAHEVARRSALTTVAVGAAFDFHAGLLNRPPHAIQRLGLEWLYRLVQEPRRLWARYLTTNPRFLIGWILQATGRNPPAPVQPPGSGLPPA